MKTIIPLTIFILLVFLMRSNAQNIVPNANFETYTTCPSSTGSLPSATGWMLVSGHTGSADYLNVCTANATIDVPANAFGNQAPSSGNGYGGFAMYYQSTANFREYIQTRFTSPMVAGQTYNISFNACLSDNSQYYAPCFQFYFSNVPLTWGGSNWFPITSVTPQISSNNIISSKTTWTTFSENYTAVGGEQYMTMGNFRNDASTPGITLAAGTWTYSSIYYYIDDFTVTPIPVLLPLELIFFTGKKENKNIALNWQTQNELNVNRYVLEKSADGVIFEIVNEQQAKGNGFGAIENNYNYLDTKPFNGFNYYRLGQIDMNGQQTYSKIIAINVEEEPAPVLALSPNPVSYDMTVEYNSPQKAEISIEIYDMVGHQLLISNNLPVDAGSNNILLNVEEYPAGMYLLRVKQGSHAAAKTFIKK